MKSIDEIKKEAGISATADTPYAMGYISIGGEQAAFVSCFTPDGFKLGKTTIVAKHKLSDTEIHEVLYKFFEPDNGIYVIEQAVSNDLLVYDFYDADDNDIMEGKE